MSPRPALRRALLTLSVAALGSTASAQPSPSPPAVTFDADALTRAAWDEDRGSPQFLAGDLGVFTAAPETAAREFLTANAATFGFEAAPDVRLVRAERDDLGLEHVVVQQEVGGVPVWGAESSLHIDADGRAYAWGGALHPGAEDVQIRPAFRGDRALAEARAALGPIEERASVPAEDDADAIDWTPTASLVVYPHDGAYVLAYHVRLFVDRPWPANWEVFVDAQTGAVLHRFNSIHTIDPRAGRPAPVGVPSAGRAPSSSPVFVGAPASGSGRSLYDGTVPLATERKGGTYRLRDKTRGPKYIRTLSAQGLNWAPGGEVTDRDNQFTRAAHRAAVSVHAAAARTIDYYQDTHGRSSYDGKDGSITSTVNFDFFPGGVGFNGAFWSGEQMIYGDGDGETFSPLVDLDIVAHELTHAVTRSTAGLIYENESGALNEAVSDIFAVMVDREDYRVGEDSYTPGRSGDALRYLDNPERGDQPAHYDDRYTGSEDNGGVHRNSGIANKQAYLTMAGGSFRGQSVESIGRKATERIWYRALTRYFTASTDFAGAREGTLQATADLYGSGSKQYRAVADAWAAVGVGEASEAAPPTAPPTAPSFPRTTVWYYLENLATAERLDTDGDRRVDVDRGTATDKQWRFESAGGSYWFIENRRTGKRLSTNGCKSDVLTTGGTSDAQRWKLVDAGGDHYYLESKACKRYRLDTDGNRSPVDVNRGKARDKRWAFVEGRSFNGVLAAEPAALVAAEAAVDVLALRVYPNPAHAQATLALDVPEAGSARVVVVDLLGREVASVLDGAVEAGRRQIALDTAGLPAGVYVVVADVAGQRLTERVTVVR
ncbi:M4 family metallopeptidase [Rubrivirga litoralis]|uniref:M4 family metallopeptidase n=1 Tax=Rubrivirga litoralis TaxID=3075598 RepID=A0ABU3BM96_9BACT|nr:M4 family metallopeptidase [Rubrivirga sp. F394]MDT0630417.1 M4 family metallopeptidase [Rubrivirga sp. F394]